MNAPPAVSGTRTPPFHEFVAQYHEGHGAYIVTHTRTGRACHVPNMLVRPSYAGGEGTNNPLDAAWAVAIARSTWNAPGAPWWTGQPVTAHPITPPAGQGYAADPYGWIACNGCATVSECEAHRTCAPR